MTTWHIAGVQPLGGEPVDIVISEGIISGAKLRAGQALMRQLLLRGCADACSATDACSLSTP